MTRPSLAEPVEVVKFWKSARDRAAHVRIELSEFKGHPLVNIRVWETGSDGVDRPSVKGIALAIAKLPELAAGITKALAKARELGLIDGDAGAPG